MSRPEAMTLLPELASAWHTSTTASSKNWISSMATTAVASSVRRQISSAPVARTALIRAPAWLETASAVYRVSMIGLKTWTCCLAISARRTRRISSSVLPQYMEPQISSIQP
ncbi:hypothetical protein D3C87_1572020 [compost metagenome]